MQKVVKDNIIYVDKPKMSLIPLALSAASLLFIILGAASLFYLQKPIQEVTENRSAASVGTGIVELTSQLTSSSNFTSGVPSVIDLKYDAKGTQLTGIQIVVKVQGNAETPLVEIPQSSNLQSIFQEVEKVSDGYLVSVIVTSKTLGGSFTSNGATTFVIQELPMMGLFGEEGEDLTWQSRETFRQLALHNIHIEKAQILIIANNKLNSISLDRADLDKLVDESYPNNWVLQEVESVTFNIS